MREELNVPLVRQTHSVSSGPSNISPLPHPMTTSQPPVLVTKVATSHFGGSSGRVVISRPGGRLWWHVLRGPVDAVFLARKL